MVYFITGSGKSSLLRIMCGLWRPDRGKLVSICHNSELGLQCNILNLSNI